LAVFQGYESGCNLVGLGTRGNEWLFGLEIGIASDYCYYGIRNW